MCEHLAQYRYMEGLLEECYACQHEADAARIAALEAEKNSYMAEVQRLRAGLGRLKAKMVELLEGGLQTAYEHKPNI